MHVGLSLSHSFKDFKMFTYGFISSKDAFIICVYYKKIVICRSNKDLDKNRQTIAPIANNELHS